MFGGATEELRRFVERATTRQELREPRDRLRVFLVFQDSLPQQLFSVVLAPFLYQRGCEK